MTCSISYSILWLHLIADHAIASVRSSNVSEPSRGVHHGRVKSISDYSDEEAEDEDMFKPATSRVSTHEQSDDSVIDSQGFTVISYRLSV